MAWETCSKRSIWRPSMAITRSPGRMPDCSAAAPGTSLWLLDAANGFRLREASRSVSLLPFSQGGFDGRGRGVGAGTWGDAAMAFGKPESRHEEVRSEEQTSEL